jgi:hypothetical protein
VHYISSQIPENTHSDTCHLTQTVKQLKQDVQAIQTRLNL